jgi:DNA-binding NarL/FixJ family response regulator
MIKKRVLIVDEHPVARRGLLRLINDQADMITCGETDSWRQALSMIEKLKPHLVVTELRLKDGNGWELVSRSALGQIDVPVFVLCDSSERLYALRLVQAGARGFMMKSASEVHILAALKKALAGGIGISDAIEAQMFELFLNKPRNSLSENPLTNLSDREVQVLEYIQRRKTGKEIADSMGISVKTVSTYKWRLFKKFNVRNATELQIVLEFNRELARKRED